MSEKRQYAGSYRTFIALLLGPVLLFTWISLLLAGGVGPNLSSPLLPPSVVGEVIAGVSTAELETHVCHLQDDDDLTYCNTQGNRYSFNPAGLQEAAGYIADQLRGYPGITVTTQAFSPPGPTREQQGPFVLTNVVGTLAGVAPPAERGVVIISAHYDSTASGAAAGGPAPGADDNASGVAGVLEAARLLSERELRHTVRFIAFAGEEQGLHGSQYYAENARRAGENIIGVVNLDMIGYESDGEPRLEIHAGDDTRNVALADTLVEAIGAYHLDLLPQPILDGATRLSDHASFWDRGFPAMLVIEDTDLVGPSADFNPHYHSAEDTLDKMNRAYFAEMARAVIGTVTRLAQPTGPDLQVTQRGPAVVSSGETVTFTMAYSNGGTVPAAGVILTDTLSGGLIYQSDSSGLPRAFALGGQVVWELGELDVNAGGRFVVTATVRYGGDVMAVTSRAMVAGQGLDADAVDNVSTVEASVRDEWRAYVPLLKLGVGSD